MTTQIDAWGANSEYGVLRDVLLCRPDYFRWLPTSSISKATLRSGAAFDRQRTTDRKSVVQGKSVDLGGRRIIKKKNIKHITTLSFHT